LARAATVFACQSCGATSPKWLGRCPECGEWNSFVEEARASRPASVAALPARKAEPLGDVDARERPRLATTMPGLDRVLGGGLVPGAVVLLGGEPGIGKSTLLLQAGRGIAESGGLVLYATAEESASQVRLRAERLRARSDRLLVLAEGDVAAIAAEAGERSPALLIVDSIQAVRESGLTSGAGTVSQVRECAARLAAWAKAVEAPAILIGHVTKDGSLAGPKSLEHMVDVVVSLEGDRGSSRRILRAAKNRFGTVDELALYEMGGEGLEEIANPSAALLEGRRAGVPGSAVTAAREGSRSLLLEIQALVGPAAAGSPRRVAIGVDGSRLSLLLAVLENAGLALSSREVFVSCTGGLEVSEPAADLAIVAALASSARGRTLPADAVFFGEIGLLGEIRRVPAASGRLREASAMGFASAYLPSGNAGDAAGVDGVDAQPVGRVEEFLERIGMRPAGSGRPAG
jgi:DNA repair protein RadA/Sms